MEKRELILNKKINTPSSFWIMLPKYYDVSILTKMREATDIRTVSYSPPNIHTRHTRGLARPQDHTPAFCSDNFTGVILKTMQLRLDNRQNSCRLVSDPSGPLMLVSWYFSCDDTVFQNWGILFPVHLVENKHLLMLPVRLLERNWTKPLVVPFWGLLL